MWAITCLIISLLLFSLSTLVNFFYIYLFLSHQFFNILYLFSSIFIYILIISFRLEKTIRLNFKDLKALDSFIIGDYDDWVNEVPDHWKLDGSL